MTGVEVIPEPYAPYPDETYTAVETTTGEVEIQDGDSTVTEITKTEFDALFKPKGGD